MTPSRMLAAALFQLVAVSPAFAGPEIRAYPAGVIGTARLDLPIAGRWVAGVSAGYNLARRGRLGEHDDERGGGPGVGLGVDYRPHGAVGFFGGVRTDVWWLGIDWTDRSPARTGRTTTTVLQPTARIGWGWLPGGGRWRVEASAALGAEINTATRGEPVGEGAIMLIGVALLRRF